jgi:pseudouridine-5'-phosphate glycosidase
MLGMGEVSKVAMVFYACLWPILLSTVAGARGVDPLLIRSAIETAVEEAGRQQIESKAVTPFLLSRISAITEGKSLAANIALAKNNARLAAQIATAFAHHADTA